MNGQGENKTKRIRLISYLPELLVLLICGVMLLGNIDRKQGYHMDELLSFELANAEFNPWIVPTQPQGRLAKFVENELRGESFGETVDNMVATAKDVVENRGSSKLLSYKADVYEEPVWIERETFVDYVTVEEKDDFSYLSVYFNVKDDNHPPLHFALLHTVSSVFKGELTPFMGCVINLVCVLGIMILLMKLGRWLMQIWGVPEWGRWAGLLAAVLYGLSVGAVSTTLLIRMYAMLTLWCVALLAIHVRKLYSYLLGGTDFTENNKGLILVTVLGFWTQYFFLFYCLVLAAVTVVVLWIQKRKQGLWCYIRSMVLAGIIGVGLFPFSIADVFSSGRGVEALENLSQGFAGYGSRILAFGEILVRETGCVYLLVPVIMVLCVLVATVGRSQQRSTQFKARNGAGLQALLWIPVFGYFLLSARMSPYLVNRYIMPMFPLFILAVVATLCKGIGILVMKQDKAKGVRFVLGVIVCVMMLGQLVVLAGHESEYLYLGYDDQRQLAEEYSEYPCICVYQGVGYYENLLEFMEYEKTLLVTDKELAERKETESLKKLSGAVVLVKAGLDKEMTESVLEEKYGLHRVETLMDEEGPYGDSLFVVECR